MVRLRDPRKGHSRCSAVGIDYVGVDGLRERSWSIVLFVIDQERPLRLEVVDLTHEICREGNNKAEGKGSASV